MAGATEKREGSYLVLKRITDTSRIADPPEGALIGVGYYEVVDEDVKATKPVQAIEKHVEGNKHATDIAGVYVAVATNRFHAVEVAAKTDVVLTIGRNGDEG